MTNTSATGGYLLPNPPPAPQPLEDDALADFFNAVIAGITGLDGSLVRPRWQIIPPNIPANTVNWCAFGIVNRKADVFPFVGHDAMQNSGDGADVLQRQEILEFLCSFYGPQAEANASQLRDGLFIEQNRAVLSTMSMTVVECGDMLRAPTLKNEQWYQRVDLPMFIRREILRTYPVLNLLSISGVVETDIAVVNDQGFERTFSTT